MTGDDFLELAAKLKEMAAPNEATHRTAISRAYYGAYHLARAFLAELGVRVGKDHGDVWNRLGKSGVVDAKKAATMLAVLHENRVVADYQLESTKPRNAAFVEDNIERARAVRLLPLACRQEPKRTEVKEGIERPSTR
jgi:uncharacterized protein (UPF0332 family)